MDNTGDSKTIAKNVLDVFKDMGLFTVGKNKDGTYSVNLTKLTDEQYKEAINKLNNLNERGMNQ